MSPVNSLVPYCEALVRFIAVQMLDPHRYFEQKLLGELAQCANDEARATLLARLVQWLGTERLLTDAQRDQLDCRLAREGWPSTALAERDPELTLLLLSGASLGPDRARLQRALADEGLGTADRGVVQARLQASAD